MRTESTDSLTACRSCDHSFHTAHLAIWLSTKSHCPYCKTNFPEDLVDTLKIDNASLSDEELELINSVLQRTDRDLMVSDLKQARKSCVVCLKSQPLPLLYCQFCYSLYHENHLEIWKKVMTGCAMCDYNLEETIQPRNQDTGATAVMALTGVAMLLIFIFLSWI